MSLQKVGKVDMELFEPPHFIVVVIGDHSLIEPANTNNKTIATTY